jgi:antitoxin ParD1/3/4
LAILVRLRCIYSSSLERDMNVVLTPQHEELVRSKLASGHYSSASEVVREALCLLEAQDRLRHARLEALQRDLHKGLASGASQPWDADAVKARARARRCAKAATA